MACLLSPPGNSTAGVYMSLSHAQPYRATVKCNYTLADSSLRPKQQEKPVPSIYTLLAWRKPGLGSFPGGKQLCKRCRLGYRLGDH